MDEDKRQTADLKIALGEEGKAWHRAGECKVTLDNFEFLKVLGKGTFGKVIMCREKATNQLFAMKVLKKQALVKKNAVALTMTEKRVLQRVNHPFLLSLRCSFATADRLHLVLEYVSGGDLFFHLKADGVFSEDRTCFYGAEIVCALGYLHRQALIHRDIKLENLLLDREGHIKIADFGMCKENIAYGNVTKTFCGTREFLAPEVLEDLGHGQSVDWWGTGLAMYEMMSGELPFYHPSQQKMFENILSKEVHFPPHISPSARDLLGGLLAKNPGCRLGGGPTDAEEIMQHVFFASVNWKDLEERKVPPPFKPLLTSDTDTRYFDKEITDEAAELTMPDGTQRPSEIFPFSRFEEGIFF
jgi:RAC serine/threonine-protein kinase